MISLDILSDPICPWCYIGKTYLDAALRQRPEHGFVITWHPFQLNPDMPVGGMDRQAYLDAKFGGRAQAEAVYGRINDAAQMAGLEIDFAAISRTPNTIDAHRLIHWAGIEGRQNAVVDALFEAYFHDGKDIGDPAVLQEVAASAGLDAAMVGQLLAGTADREEVAARDAHSRERGVTGVPTFIVAERHVVPGAQPPEVWTRVIDDLASQTA